MLAAVALCCASQPCEAAGYRSNVRYAYNRSGGLTAVRMVIQSETGLWTFTLSRQVLDLPVATQVALLDRRYGLGVDREVVRQVLESIRQGRQQDALRQQQDALRQQQEALRRQLDQVNRMNQPAWQPPVIPRIR